MDGITYINGNSSITLTAVDPVVQSTASGVAFTEFKVDDGTFTVYASTSLSINGLSFMITAEGRHVIEFRSGDNAGNLEIIKSTVIYVDNTPPAAPLTALANGTNPSPWSGTGIYSVSITTPSDASGISKAYIKACSPPSYSSDGTVFTPETGTGGFSASCLADGENAAYTWLEDNVGNSGYSSPAQLTLRLDRQSPVSGAAAPSIAGAPFQVSFTAEDGLSGVEKTVLWHRNRDYGVSWSSGSFVLAGASGSFSFVPAVLRGNFEFYTQSFDNVGNYETAPGPDTAPKAATSFSVPAPVISNVNYSEVSYDRATVSWETNEDTTGTVEYGTSTVLGMSYRDGNMSRSHRIVLPGLTSPTRYYFRVTAVNGPGVAAVDSARSFTTPANVTLATDIFGAVDYNQPITVAITNPEVSSITFTIGGQTVTQAVSTSAPVQIFIGTAAAQGGTQTFSLVLNDYTYQTQFTLDPATRTVRLARLVIDQGGIMASWNSGMADMTSGQEVQDAMYSPTGKVYTGYYAGIDPAAPEAVTDLSASSGPGRGEISLVWISPGDDANAGTAMKYDLRWSLLPITASNFNAAAVVPDTPLPLVAGTKQRAVITGLADGTSYYFALKAFDELMQESFSNTASARTRIYDGAAPVIAVSSPSAGEKYYAGGAPVRPVFSVMDDQDPGPEVMAVIMQREDRGSPTGARPSSMTVVSGQEIEPLLMDDGLWELVIEARDWNNNYSSAATGMFEVIHDTNAPETKYEVSGTKYENGGITYINADSGITLSAVDPVINGVASGVLKTEFALDTTTYQTYFSSFTLAEGTHTLAYYSTDNVGNTEATVISTVAVDATAPETGLQITDYQSPVTTSPVNGIVYINGNSSITLAAVDPSVNGAASGVSKIELAVDTTTYRTYLSSFTLSEGTHVISYRSIDNVGNIEAEKTVYFNVDNAAPVSTAAIAGTAGLNGWYNSSVEVTIVSTDSLSGIAGSSYSLDGGAFAVYNTPFMVNGEGAHTVKFKAADNVGNAETERTLTFWIDVTTPVVAAAASPSADANGWNKEPVTVTFTGTDTVSGIAYCSPQAVIGVEGSSRTVSGYCSDYSGLSHRHYAAGHSGFGFAGRERRRLE